MATYNCCDAAEKLGFASCDEATDAFTEAFSNVVDRIRGEREEALGRPLTEQEQMALDVLAVKSCQVASAVLGLDIGMSPADLISQQAYITEDIEEEMIAEADLMGEDDDDDEDDEDDDEDDDDPGPERTYN